MAERGHTPTDADQQRAREALAGLLVEYSDTDGPVTSYTTGPADGDEDAVLNLAERFAEVRADERAKLQDRIEELEKNLSYEVEQKIKLADTLRDERAKRPDRAALERIAAECEADIPYDDGNETAKLIGKRIREALALEPDARDRAIRLNEQEEER